MYNTKAGSKVGLVVPRPIECKIWTHPSYYAASGEFIYIENMLHSPERRTDRSHANWIAEIMSTPCDIMKCSACESGWKEKPTLNCGYCRKLITGQEPIFRWF